MNKLSIAVITVVLLLAMPALSQISERTWTADIPYDFIVAGNHMPAGQYIVKSNAQTMRLTLANKETGQKASMFTHNVEKVTPDYRTVLIFQREGDGGYVLHQIWGGYDSFGGYYSTGLDVVHGSEVIELSKVQ